MSSSQVTGEPLEEVDFEAELAALEQEQDAPVTQELPENNTEATQEVAPDVADVKKTSENVKAPPPSSDTTEALAEEAPPLSEEAKKVKTTKTPSNELELSKEKAPEPAASSAALLSKPAKKPLVGRKPPAAEKAEAAPAAEPSAPKKGKLRIMKARVVEVEEEEEDNADAAPATSRAAGFKVDKPSLVKKASPVAAAQKATLLSKTKAPAVKKAPAATTTAAVPTGPLVKRAKNAYFIFNEENRARVKEENPGAKMGDLNKLLGAAYHALSEEEKAVYISKAAEDKLRMEREIAEGGVLPARKTKAAGAGAVANKKPAAKRLNNSPYDLFCEEQRPILKKGDPKAGAPELSKRLSDAWKQLDDYEKAPYMQRSKELKTAAKEAAAAAADNEENESSLNGAASRSKKRPTKTSLRKVGAGTKRAKVAALAAASDDDDEVMHVAGAEEDDEDDIDRVNVDWEAYPAYSILSKTKSMYIVARRGLPLFEYGEVPIEAANLQLRAGQTPTNADGTPAKPCPLTLELLDEYDAFCKDFRHDVFDSSDGNELDLEHLRDGSLLEACSFLGSMREAGHELAAPMKKNDIPMKVPTMATSRLMQRIINVERLKYEELESKYEEVKAQLAAALGEGGDGAAAEVVEKGAAGADAQEAVIAEA